MHSQPYINKERHTENPHRGKHTAMKKILSLVVILAAFGQIAQAQQGFGTSNPAPSSVIDMTATNKGALLPRVALTSTTVAAPVNAPANALTVFNTATTGDVTPGYYYWSVPQAKWVRLLTETPAQDLRLVGTGNHITQDAGSGSNGTSAGTGQHNIGIGEGSLNAITSGFSNVGIGYNTLMAVTNESFNVALGSISLSKATSGFNTALGHGALYDLTTGAYNTFIGAFAGHRVTTASENIAIGRSAFSTSTAQPGTGNHNLLIGNESGFLLQNGSRNVGLGFRAFYSAGGLPTGLTTGNDNIAIGHLSGVNITTGSNNFVVGSSARVQTATASDQMNIKNAIFGTGMNGTLAAPAGSIGINVAAPSNALHVFATANPVRFQGLQTGTITGATPDMLVVADGNGVLKTVAAAAVASGVRGGLRNNIVTGGFTELGGDLVRETSINTTVSGITHKLNITGLPVDATTSDYVMMNSAGQLKMLETEKVSAAAEPWQVQGLTTKATSNTQAIYQNAKVAIGDFSVGGASATSAKQFEVKGNFKSEMAAAGGVVGTEVGSPLNPNGAMHYWSNGNNYRTSSANDFSATLEAKTGAVTNTVTARDIQAALSSLNGTNSLSSIRATQSGEFFAEAYNVSGQYSATVSLLPDALRLVHSNTGGAADPFPNTNRSELIVRKAEGVGVALRDAGGAVKANYFLPVTSGTAGQVLTKTTGNATVWANPVATPKFFYAPSMVMPTSNTDLPAHVTYNAGTQTFTVDMYAIYNGQFGMTGDVGGAARTAIKSTGAGSLDVLAANALGYFVTYFDNTVYDPASIALTADGKLSYKILTTATVTAKTYMNVVFKQL